MILSYFAMFLAGLTRALDADGILPAKAYALSAVAVFCAWVGVGNASFDLPLPLWGVILFSGLVAASNLTRGDTNWPEQKAQVFRFLFGVGARTGKFRPTGTVFAAFPVLIYSGTYGTPSDILFAIAFGLSGALMAPVYYYGAQNRPAFLDRLAGDRDIAAIPAGMLCIGLLAFT